MAYEPLHHKYRPQTFQDLVGQTAIATTLSNAIVQQRIAPAYLFSGPRGTGKTSSARILAKSLNCQTGDKPTPQPCGTCEACHSITTGIALDVIEIDAASNTGVDNIRELIEKAQFAPVQCRYKVYVIDECHMLSTAAFNALLKTLEEPPERVVFVLATTDPQRVLPTIISRCQRFDYRRIPLEEMVGHLRHIADQELIDINDDALRLVAQLSQGGLRDAESLLDQLSLLPPPVAIEAVWDLVGAVPERELFTITQAIASNNAESVIERARQLMDRGREPLVVLQNLASFYRDLLVARTAPKRNDLVAITPDTWAQMTQFVQQLDVAAILQGQQHLRSSEVQLKNSTQPRLWLEVTLMGLLPAALVQPQGTAMAVAAPVIPVAPVVPAVAAPPAVPQVPNISPPIQVPAPPAPPAAIQGAASTPGIAAAPPATPTSPSVAPVQPASTQPAPDPGAEPAASAGIDLGQMWQQVIANVEYRSTQMLLRQQSQLMRFTGTVAHIAVTQQWLSSIQTRQAAIEGALAKVAGAPVKIKLDAVAQKPDAPPPGGVAPVGGASAATAPPAPPTPAATQPAVSASSAPPPVPAAPVRPPAPVPAAAPQTAAPVAPPAAKTSPASSSASPGEVATSAAPKVNAVFDKAAPESSQAISEVPVDSAVVMTNNPAVPASPDSSLAETSPASASISSESESASSEPIPTDPGPIEDEVEISIDPMAGLIPLPTLSPMTPIESAVAGNAEAEVADSQAQLAPIGDAALPPTMKHIWEEDEIVRSAKQLAQFFNGEVVREEVQVGDISTQVPQEDGSKLQEVVVEAVAMVAPQASSEMASSEPAPAISPAPAVAQTVHGSPVAQELHAPVMQPAVKSASSAMSSQDDPAAIPDDDDDVPF